jgi:hypothetical protein
MNETTIKVSKETAQTFRLMSAKSGKEQKEILRQFAEILQKLLESYDSARYIDCLSFEDRSGRAVVFALIPTYSDTLYGKGESMFETILKDLANKEKRKVKA